MPPLALTDAQLDVILAAAEPLVPDDRSKFLGDVAAALDGQELGDGLIGRVCREVQRRYFSAPDVSRTSRYRYR